jgi:hypothetical protein
METFTDENGQTWTHDEVQFLVCQVASLNKAARRLGVKPAQLRKWKIKSATEWVREKAMAEPGWLVGVIVQQNGRERAAKFLNVSTTFICGLLTALDVKWSSPRPEAEQVQTLMVKFGSPILVARMLGTTVNEVKKALPTWKDHRDPTKAGNHSIRTGRIGEEAFCTRREGKAKLVSLDNHNHPGFDATDVELGNVSVKTTGKSKAGKWTWEFKSAEEFDTIALVGMDHKKKVVEFVAVLTKREVIDLNLSLRSNGKYAITFGTVRSTTTISGIEYLIRN